MERLRVLDSWGEAWLVDVEAGEATPESEALAAEAESKRRALAAEEMEWHRVERLGRLARLGVFHDERTDRYVMPGGSVLHGPAFHSRFRFESELRLYLEELSCLYALYSDGRA